MSVLLPNARVMHGRRPHPWARDAQGVPIPTGSDPVESGPWDASLIEQPSTASVGTAGGTPGALYTFRLDPRCWPLEEGDTLRDLDTGRTFVVMLEEARLFTVPGYDDADYIGGKARLDPPESA